jgi:signal peptidase I
LDFFDEINQNKNIMLAKKNRQGQILGESANPSIGAQVKDFIVELIKVVLISLAIIVPVRYFLIQPFYVKGASMEPTFFDHEYLIIDEISYRFHEPVRGDVIVFKYPRDPKQYFIKRVIGLPGETIEIKDGQVFIYNKNYPTGIALEEKFYLSGLVATEGDKITVLKNDEYFILGDNRPSSLDSRNFGPLPEKMIVGRVLLRGWPFDRVGLFKQPVYNIVNSSI